ncbi:hypothetical protein FJW04_17880 [Mesorhizobium sp. B2-7-3]|uniref:SCO family protein n=1 Tax=Mesorhizobium sp. B2-7-3 TaxID=2589907 RepID=UPI00112A398C|nr:SCO family protein [Mesorhizobium sp. B2-7-3]TPJ14358.1 hypothetical protein FJW04_17880 [Mesorhizobium sp. B2-7-3]
MKSLALVVLLTAGLLSAVQAKATVSRPALLPPRNAGIDPDLAFLEASGVRRPFKDVLDGKAAVLLIGYNKCPNLCGLTQNIVADALEQSGLETDAYRAVFVSIDPRETAADAKAGKAKLARIMNRTDMPAWRFLTGDDASIGSLAHGLGYTYQSRERINQFVHPVSVAVLTPQARLSRLLSSTTLKPRDLRLALVEASSGSIGTYSDQVVLLCSGFDTSRGQYTPLIGRVLSVSGGLTLALLGGLIFILSRKPRGIGNRRREKTP